MRRYDDPPGYGMTDVFHRDQDSIVQVSGLFIQTARLALKYADRCFYVDAHSSTAKYMVLQSLFFNNRTMTLSDLATFTATERHNITTLVNRMKQEGLVTTRRSRQDRRSQNVTITDEGINVLKKLWLVGRKISETLTQSMTEDDLNKLLKNLDTIHQNVSEALGGSIPSTESSG